MKNLIDYTWQRLCENEPHRAPYGRSKTPNRAVYCWGNGYYSGKPGQNTENHREGTEIHRELTKKQNFPLCISVKHAAKLCVIIDRVVTYFFSESKSGDCKRDVANEYVILCFFL